MIFFKLIFKAIAFLLALIIAIPLISTARVWWTGIHPAEGSAKYAVVLGAAQLNGRPGAVLTARLTQARDLYKSNRVEKIITVGFSQPGDRTTEAKAGAVWLRANGVTRNDVIVVSAGTDTYTSTVAYAQKIPDKSQQIFVVTDPWHCLRYLFREAGAYLAYITLGRRGIHLSDHSSKQASESAVRTGHE